MNSRKLLFASFYFCFSTLQITLNFSVAIFFVMVTTHSRYTVENHFISRVQPLGCITINKRPPGRIQPTAVQEACGAFGDDEQRHKGTC